MSRRRKYRSQQISAKATVGALLVCNSANAFLWGGNCGSLYSSSRRLCISKGHLSRAPVLPLPFSIVSVKRVPRPVFFNMDKTKFCFRSLTALASIRNDDPREDETGRAPPSPQPPQVEEHQPQEREQIEPSPDILDTQGSSTPPSPPSEAETTGRSNAPPPLTPEGASPYPYPPYGYPPYPAAYYYPPPPSFYPPPPPSTDAPSSSSPSDSSTVPADAPSPPPYDLNAASYFPGGSPYYPPPPYPSPPPSAEGEDDNTQDPNLSAGTAQLQQQAAQQQEWMQSMYGAYYNQTRGGGGGEGREGEGWEEAYARAMYSYYPPPPYYFDPYYGFTGPVAWGEGEVEEEEDEWTTPSRR
ncbi:hypothetical protein Naga_100367g1 [Nannochloropsis gaditana]|uniref:Uncharacterized protein n=1 Tax=Nannochloropsis gaditana TaxID=72520 RepID=W7U6G2_9STRA|nr:hypothetical protein Naga_100367g1 [Nannochloropsis gaditana]